MGSVKQAMAATREKLRIVTGLLAMRRLAPLAAFVLSILALVPGDAPGAPAPTGSPQAVAFETAKAVLAAPERLAARPSAPSDGGADPGPAPVATAAAAASRAGGPGVDPAILSAAATHGILKEARAPPADVG